MSSQSAHDVPAIRVVSNHSAGRRRRDLGEALGRGAAGGIDAFAELVEMKPDALSREAHRKTKPRRHAQARHCCASHRVLEREVRSRRGQDPHTRGSRKRRGAACGGPGWQFLLGCVVCVSCPPRAFVRSVGAFQPDELLLRPDLDQCPCRVGRRSSTGGDGCQLQRSRGALHWFWRGWGGRWEVLLRGEDPHQPAHRRTRESRRMAALIRCR